MSSSQFHYPECTKGGSHIGEVLNIVCLEPKCIQKSVICGICYDEEHRDHKIRPLKVIISNSKKYLEGLTPLTLDVDVLKADSHRLELWYAHHGWFDARFGGWEIRRAREASARRAGVVDLLGHVHPGHPSFVPSLDFTSTDTAIGTPPQAQRRPISSVNTAT